MSLINDALKKARLEAARESAADRSIPYPAVGRRERSPANLWVASLGAVLLLAALGGLFLYRAGRQSALETTVAERTISGAPASESSSSGAPAPTATAEYPASESSSSGSQAGPASPPDSRLSPPPSSASETGGADVRPVPEAPAPRSEPSPPRPEPTPRPPASGTTPAGVPRQAQTTAALPTRPPAEAPPRSQAPGPAEPAGNGLAEPADEASRPSSPPPPDAPRPAATVAAPADSEPAGDGAAASPETAEVAAQEFLRGADIPGIGPIELGGIAWSGDRPFALVNGRVVRPGDSVAGLFVEEIRKNTVSFRSDDGRLIFRLK